MSTSPPPDNLFKLKQTLEDLTDQLKLPKDITEFERLGSEVDTFFLTAYSKLKDTTVLDITKQKIESIEEFDTRYSEFVTACEKYVNAAKEIFDSLDTLITKLHTQILDKFLNDTFLLLTENFNKEIVPIIEAIDKLKSPVPDASSSSPAFTPEQDELNAHLEALKIFLKEMGKQFIDSIKKNIEEEFSDYEIKKLIESDTSDVQNDITFKINTMSDKLLQGVDKKQEEFKELLDNKKSGSPSDKIIVNASTITIPFDDMIKGLKKNLKRDGGTNTFFDAINEVYYIKAITPLIETINKQVVKLSNVPVMADEEEEQEAGGGGNGDGATLDTYPVSNKSQKNRNKGKGNSKGRGKGKGKGRKPNATKKNNRH